MALTTFGSIASHGSFISAARVPMSAPFASAPAQLAISRGSIVGRSPCRLMTVLNLRYGSMFESASNMRSEPLSWPARVMIAVPPAREITPAISGESVATKTGPAPDSIARFQTCTIIGAPAMSSKGFRGRRVALSRAGIIMSAWAAVCGIAGCDNSAYRVACL
jgi:hypothetical protein